MYNSDKHDAIHGHSLVLTGRIDSREETEVVGVYENPRKPNQCGESERYTIWKTGKINSERATSGKATACLYVSKSQYLSFCFVWCREIVWVKATLNTHRLQYSDLPPPTSRPPLQVVFVVCWSHTNTLKWLRERKVFYGLSFVHNAERKGCERKSWRWCLNAHTFGRMNILDQYIESTE